MVGEAGEALVVRIPDRAGARGQSVRQEGVVDAEPISASAERGKLAKFRIAAAPQVTKPADSFFKRTWGYPISAIRSM